MLPDSCDTSPTGHSAVTETARVKTVACLGGVSLERGIATDQISEYIRDASNLVWIDVQDPGPAELSMLLEEFGFHPLALEDVAKGQQRPKIDEYKGYMFVVTYALESSESIESPKTVEVDLFIGRNYVVSVHRGRVPALEDAYGRWTRGGVMLREGVGFLVYALMDAIIDAYFPVIDRIEDAVDDTELDIFTHSTATGVQKLLKLKRSLVTLRRVLYPLRDIFSVFLRREQPIFSANTILYFQDVHDHVLRILDVLEIEREMVSGALEAYLTIISNRLNMTMKTLAIITVVVAIFGSTFGAWGMNFQWIPFASEPWGFWAVAAGSCALTAGVLLGLWKRGWL